MRLAVYIQRANLWVRSEPDRAVLMGHTGKRDALADL